MAVIIKSATHLVNSIVNVEGKKEVGCGCVNHSARFFECHCIGLGNVVLPGDNAFS
eukprot:CAMPEP_0171707122 /NCGR_PEP_ID=MMETSP0991-20121206/14166_1 /TAXON_ID=483369 /ORGANISM="non described non described, Strain CCMP2098" /LENGTH=55 /DNA_ID=CAMNT_0012296921 /DNA_START=316 /DNA_END=483 /DNA_ORIENTATION=-